MADCPKTVSSWASGWPVDDCAHPEGGRSSSEPRTSHDVADVHARALAGAAGGRFLHHEVWTVGGLMTYYTAFVIELHFRRVHLLGSTRHPDEAFVVQAFRGLTAADDVLRAGRFLICDRDPKWSGAMEALLRTVDVRVVRTSIRWCQGSSGGAS
jgi:hypothetical protein